MCVFFCVSWIIARSSCGNLCDRLSHRRWLDRALQCGNSGETRLHWKAVYDVVCWQRQPDERAHSGFRSGRRHRPPHLDRYVVPCQAHLDQSRNPWLPYQQRAEVPSPDADRRCPGKQRPPGMSVMTGSVQRACRVRPLTWTACRCSVSKPLLPSSATICSMRMHRQRRTAVCPYGSCIAQEEKEVQRMAFCR